MGVSGRMSAVGLMRRELRLPEPVAAGGAVLEARGVTVAYGGHPVVDDVDLTVRAGDIVALVGPNGAGKSTLLGVLAGDLTPDRGTVTVDGAPIASWRPNELAIRRGVLLQRVALSFPFTVTQVVRMGRAPWSSTTAEDWDDAVVAAAMVETDVRALADRVFTSLSGGEQARAALARVLAQEASVLLLDEPTASLDIRHQEQVLRVARSRADRGDAIVVVLHDLDIAAAHADVVVVLSNGRVRAQGRPDEVCTTELLSDVYEHPVEVLRHPRTGGLVILPWRDTRVATDPSHLDRIREEQP
jgi:iron complex transport system ATP-binding protein